MSNYYNRFGGYPLSSETYYVYTDSAKIELLVTYRYFLQDNVADTTSLNVSIKPIIDDKDLSKLHIDRIALFSLDNSYLMTYAEPAVYGRFSKAPISTGTTEKPCVFTVSSTTPEYNILLSYRILNQNNEWVEKKHSISIDITNPARKIPTNKEANPPIDE